MKGLNISLIAWLVFIGGSSLLFSCKGEKETGVLSQEEMVRVLTEIYIVEDKVNRLTMGPDTSRQIFNRMRERISEKTGIPETTFLKSLDYYTQRPKQMEQIYTALVDSLNLKEQRAGQAK
ncbi:MAG TPA: DUF4296 domain-containing protein [Sphingobacteriaceae bacterium]